MKSQPVTQNAEHETRNAKHGTHIKINAEIYPQQPEYKLLHNLIEYGLRSFLIRRASAFIRRSASAFIAASC
jgi:hypothetical protein